MDIILTCNLNAMDIAFTCNRNAMDSVFKCNRNAMDIVLTCNRNVNVETETVLLLILDKRQQIFPAFHFRYRSRSFQVPEIRKALRTDRPELRRRPDPVPLFHRSGGGHEPELAPEQRSVLQTEVRFDGRKAWVREGHEHASQSPVLRLEDTASHLRGRSWNRATLDRMETGEEERGVKQQRNEN